jgi:hypothetical protein
LKRWMTILGRFGTTLIAVSLALLLVSIVPSINTYQSSGSGHLSPGNIRIMFNIQNLNPQHEMEVTVAVEGTITIYLLELDPKVTFNLTIGFIDYNFTSTDLLEVLKEQPDKVIWKQEAESGDYTWRYVPTRVMNATVVAYNQPDAERAHLDASVSLHSSLAPKDKVRTIAYVAAPVGVILALPWLVTLWKERKQK